MQVFYTSPWVPPEWIKAHGLEPRGVWLGGDCRPLPLAAGVCAFAESAVRLVEAQPDSAVVFSTHCDQLRRGYDVAAGAASGRVFLFNLPTTWQTAVAGKIFASELERLARFMVAMGGHPPTTGALAETMGLYRWVRADLLEAAAELPARQFSEAVARFYSGRSINLGSQAGRALRCATGPVGTELAGAASRSGVRALPGIPLAVVGGPLAAGQGNVLDAIERAGGRVVLNATEAGERSLGQRFVSDEDLRSARTRSDLLHVLTRVFLDNCVDVFQRPNTRLYGWLKERLGARKVRGIVLWHYVGCDLWRAEAQPLREAFGLPVLLLDTNESAGDASRQVGRIQAFLESLG
jgi:benzoyl-CoA reductase/2-hydroxyglutaryl-CoA dehydratase subunit BcrC/BadD/HgdB